MAVMTVWGFFDPDTRKIRRCEAEMGVLASEIRGVSYYELSGDEIFVVVVDTYAINRQGYFINGDPYAYLVVDEQTYDLALELCA
jgi:hypothetical protein